MSVEDDLDRAEILSDFGEQVRWKGDEIQAVWYQPYSQILDTEGDAPAIMVRASDVLGAAHGDEVKRTISGVTTDYTVRGVQPDGTGMTLLVLEEQ